MPFSIDPDFYLFPSFQDILNGTRQKEKLPWYYCRSPWELYDLSWDPEELVNLACDASYSRNLTTLKEKLVWWQNATADPRILCAGRGAGVPGLVRRTSSVSAA